MSKCIALLRFFDPELVRVQFHMSLSFSFSATALHTNLAFSSACVRYSNNTLCTML